MSIVVLEAGREGTPVIVTDKCDFDVVECIGGGVVAEANAASIASSLCELLSSNGRLAEMGNKLQEYVQREFSWNNMVNRYIDLYRRVACVD